MGDSDDEYDRKRRDKFRGERAEASYRGTERVARPRDDWAERDSWSRPRPREYRPGVRDRGYSPSMDPAPKRMRYDHYETGGYYNHYQPYHQPAHRAGNFFREPPAAAVQSEGQQPPMMSFKAFLATQDDNISDSEAIEKYNDYKLEFQRQQLNEFFVAHKDDEWFRLKYHPEDSVRRKDEQMAALKKRVDVFLELMNNGKIAEVSVDCQKTSDLLKLLDTVVVKLEGGTEEDLAVLEQEYAVDVKKDNVEVNSEKPSAAADGSGAKKEESAAAGEAAKPQQDTENAGSNGKDKENGEIGEIPSEDGEIEQGPGGDEKKEAAVVKEEAKKPEPEEKMEEVEECENEETTKKDEGKEDDKEETKEEPIKEEVADENAKGGDDGDAEKEAQEEKVVPKNDKKRKRSYSGSSSGSSSSSSDSDEEKDDKKPSEKKEENEAETVADATAAPAAAASATDKDEANPKEEDSKDQIQTIEDDKPEKPKALHKTTSIFLRNLAPTITKQEVEAVCARYDGFLRVALADPQPEKRWLRRGWVTFKRDANIKEICWNLNNIRLRDCELGAIVNRDLSRRIRVINGITAHKQVVRSDIRISAKVALNLDNKVGLWLDDDAKPEKPQQTFGLVSNNPVLYNITDYLIEEASAEEEELLGLEPTSETQDATSIVERDDGLVAVLDRIILYLRVVHSVDYYNHCEYPNEDEMPNRCGILHARGPPPTTKTDMTQFIGAPVETKMASFLPEKPRDENKNETKLINLSLKDVDTEIDKFVQANTRELAKDKWLCPLSGKKFKGPDFVRKHIFNKHAEKIEEVKKEVEFFNNYLKDHKRPMLAEAPQPKREDPPTYSHPGGGGYGGGGSFGGGYGRMPPYYNQGYSQRSRGYAPRSRGGGGGDFRPVIHYRDLDAPREPEEFI